MVLSILFFVFTASAQNAPQSAVNHCDQYEQNSFISGLLVSLAAKLSYEHEEFCTNPRIADIYHEDKLVYHKEDDQYHLYEFVTIHYYEYSCEYQYNIESKAWANQTCYNTF